MTDNAYTYIIAPAVTALIGGIGYLVKYMLDKRDKKHEEETEERNKRREKIETDISDLKTEVKQLGNKLKRTQAIILSCDKPDCPSKKLLADYLDKESKEE